MDEVLIEAVEKHRILYDKEQTLFRDIAAKDSAWATISGETGASGLFVKYYLNALVTYMNYFTQQQKDAKKDGEQSGTALSRKNVKWILVTTIPPA